jgi:hypothetical protein
MAPTEHCGRQWAALCMAKPLVFFRIHSGLIFDCLGCLSYVFLPRSFPKSASMLRSSSALKVSLARPFLSSTTDPAVAVSLVSKYSDVIT